jgi:hypothetical protein
MKITINVEGKELEFLQTMQEFISTDKSVSRDEFTLEDVVLECIRTSMFLGKQMYKRRK